MEFAVRGVTFGEEAELTWRDGQIFGSTRTVELLAVKARGFRRVPVGRDPHTGQALSFGPDHLADLYGAYHLVRARAFREILEESGEIPEAPSLPPGAIP